MEKLNKKAPLFSTMHVALFLLCAVLLSAYAVSGLYARYSTGTTANDSARVAKFNVTTNAGDKAALSIDLSAATEPLSDSYEFTVSNNSEVKIAYTVTVTLPSELPVGVEMAMWLVGSGEMIPTVSGNVYQYSSTLDFTENHEWTLTFTGNPETVTEETVLNNITVEVAAEQID